MPSRIGRYPVVRELGRGGMGRIYEARDPELERRIALKVMPREVALDPERRRRFEREAKALAALNHPNIVTIHSVEREDDVPFLSMELVEGSTLDEILSEGALPLDHLLDVSVAVCEALSASHSRGVIHRDLKPSNVMVSDEGRIKLLDFGLAKLRAGADRGTSSIETLTALTGERQIMGTVPYMSPEQTVGEEIDVRTDLWALGVLLYEMSTGERPFRGETERAVLLQILHQEPPPLQELRPDAPASLEEIVGRCLTKDPGARYPTAEALLDDLRVCRRSVAQEEPGGERGPCLAVLPFETLGAPEASGFTDGIHGDLLTRLSRVAEIRVISRTSVRSYRDTVKTLSEISRELDASWVLEGEVQQVAGQVQVNVRLVEAPSDRQVWAERYRRELTAENLFQIQGEITESIAGALEVRLTPEEKERVQQAPTQDLAAYHLYVKGRANVDERTETGLRRALERFQQAIAKDSGYALAWSGLADTLSLLRFYGYPAPEGSPEALDAASRAVELDPSLGEARASLGIVQAVRREGPAALRELEQAVGLTPSYAEAHAWLAWTRLCLGQAAEGLVPASLAVELDPLAPAFRAYLAELCLVGGEGERALKEAQRARQIQPDYGLAHFMEGLVLYHLGRPGDAISVLKRALSLVPPGGTPNHAEVRAVLVAAHVARGDREHAGEIGSRIDPGDEPFSAGLVHAVLGERDEAFTTFDRVDEWGSFSTDHLRYFFPEVLGPLREDPRYERLLRRVNRSWGLEDDGSLPAATYPWPI